MNNFGRTVLALGLGTVMTFTNPECFFQAESEPTMVYAAEKAAVQGRKLTVQSRSSISVRVSADCLGKSESTIEVTTKKEEGTKASSEKNTEGSSTGKDESQTNHTTESTHTTSGSGTSSGTEGSSGSGSQTSGGNSTSGSSTSESSGSGSSTSGSSASENGTSGSSSSNGVSHQTEQTGSLASGSDGQADSDKNTTQDKNSDHLEDDRTKGNTDNTAQNNKISTRKDMEIRTKSAVKNIKEEIAEEDAPDGSDTVNTFIPKVYNDTRLSMKNHKEYIAGYIYFNQGDSAWNQNGYCIAKAGCGPTSMAVVITSLTGKWVTPLDTAIWGYQHGFYSREGSAHEMIPAMAAAYGLRCQGVGTDYQSIKKALKAGKPVVCLMGPGYFTRGGHFMVLVAIDNNDCVTVADVGSRTRSAYKYRLADVIAQSKGASAGGPFWVMSYDKGSSAARRKKAIKNYTQEDMEEDFADASYMKVTGELPELLKKEKKEVSVKKVVSILKMSTGGSLLNTLRMNDTGSSFSPVSRSSQLVSITAKAKDTKGAKGAKEAGNAEDLKKSQDQALTLKQDIARRQWEKKIPLSKLECYLKGTIEKNAFTK
ncbi:C39 family peptidase [Anaerobutyricum soehngenii]|uniref:C39 family peptidase n=1 Tax=Anaerobutyricum soehngenii TaxID=105843 RepID=A0A6N7YG89_9FIRM|nr:C39 family peptidase [Anaerobutyricum soehngenii]MSU82534.1 C39 family peptidase [Anaerobutyricum soehngenii]